jgi:hypothetical protein
LVVGGCPGTGTANTVRLPLPGAERTRACIDC